MKRLAMFALACALPLHAPAQDAKQGAMSEWEARNWAAYTQKCAEPGVIQRPSGLCYEELAAGGGPTTQPLDHVKLKLREWLVDDRMLADSANKEMAAVQPQDMLPGVQEALLLMSPGAKLRVYVPPDLGYGSRSSESGKVPPYSMLTLELEMLSRTRDCGTQAELDAPNNIGLQEDEDGAPDPRGNEVVKAGMAKLAPAISALFNQRRAKNPCLRSGTIYLELDIEGGRVVDAAAIRDNLTDPVFVEQVLELIRAASFDMKGTTRAVYYYGYPLLLRL